MSDPNPRRPKPLLLYDGECELCCKWVGRWEAMDKKGEGNLDFQPSQSGGGEGFGFSRSESLGAVKLIEENGEIRSGAAAVFRLMALGGSAVGTALWALYEGSSIFRMVTEWGYRLVADHRSFFSKLTSWF